MTFLSKQRREIYRRKIKNFWIDFRHNRVGFVGLIIIVLFIISAGLAPVLTPYQPISQLYESPTLATRFSIPEWFTVFPQFSNLNPTVVVTPDLNEATLSSQSGPLQVNLDALDFNFTPTGRGLQKASVTLDLGNFSYTHVAPPGFRMRVAYTMYFNRTNLKVYFIIKNYTAKPVWEEYFEDPTKAQMLVTYFSPPPYAIHGVVQNRSNLDLEVDSGGYDVVESLFKESGLSIEPADLIFSETGVYGIQVKFEFSNKYPFTGAYAKLHIRKVGLTLWGRFHGVLGTNFRGNDVWTELVYGSRISLMVGVLAALIATSLGIFYGVISGYLGGFVDEFLMRIVDVLLCIPVLPILLVLMRYFSVNVYLVVVLIAIFGWQGLSRVIRSRVLSLKEMAFIESARASGASDAYLITRHLIPNVLPIAMAAMVLAVPGAILTEAALSFLGFGDPNAPTWGRMLYHTYQLGGLEAWWVWLPPGLAITTICVGFVFIGHAVDEIINPRLRRRR
jgi:peptide/nickel transport system permease protein